MWRIRPSRPLTPRVVGAALVCCVALVPTRDASADGELDRLEAIWRRGDYARATQELIAYRERTGVRTLQLDYMIATSACRMPARRQLGNEFFAWILQNYTLSPPIRAQVETQRQVCSTSAAPERLPVTAPPAMVGVGIVYHGKEGTDFRFDAQAGGNSTGTMVAAIPPEQFAQRLFAPSDSTTAVRGIAKLIGPEFEVQEVGHFILAGPRSGARSAGGAQTSNAPAGRSTTKSPRQDPRDMVQQMATATPPSADELKRVGEGLERYLQFFVSEYGMRRPPSLVTVYFAADRSQLRNLARRLHGIDLAPGSIGYSFPADQSMVGWADGKAYGTFAHELFHVMVRGNFGDIPPFLDEGMAALYEVSRFERDRAVGVPNWRGALLRKYWAERPRIRELVQMNRSAFDDVAGPSEGPGVGGKQAANHATARYFMLYLQDRGELLPVYKAFRNRKVNDRPATQGVALLESVLGRSLDAVDAEFAEWFGKLSP